MEKRFDNYLHKKCRIRGLSYLEFEKDFTNEEKLRITQI